MGMYQSLSGQIRLRLTSADIVRSLRSITEQAIPIHDIVINSELEADLTVSRRLMHRLKTHTTNRGDRLTELGLYGTYWFVRNYVKRPVLLVGCLMLCLITFLASERILFVGVEGNELIPSQQILEAAKECGICFGASRRLVRSEVMKNHLLSQLPQLQWAGVNTYGCLAVITVRERAETATPEEQTGVSSIVAVRDGIVTSCTVTEGSAFCVPGQAVTKGQVLISGYSDRGLSISATHAKGEVLAATRREFSVVTLKMKMLRTRRDGPRSKYSLLIGKKRINFYKGSGISGTGCVKMYSKYVLSLPGGFFLPMALIRETYVDSALTETQIPEAAATAQMLNFAEDQLKQSMIAGSITERAELVTSDSRSYYLEGRYACTEMIGRRQEEMIGEYHGKDNRTDCERRSGG